MWVQRTPDEIATCGEAAARETRKHARLFAGLLWLVCSVLAAGGWYVSMRGGFAVQVSRSGSFWTRLAIVAVIGLPVAWLFSWRESKRELAKLARLTICPQCDATGQGNDAEPCECGGTFVSASELKWVDD